MTYATSTPSTLTPAHISTALQFNDAFITSALGLDTPPIPSKRKAMSEGRAGKRDAGLVWLQTNQIALDHAFQQNNQPEIARVKAQLLDILDPQWPNVFYYLHGVAACSSYSVWSYILTSLFPDWSPPYLVMLVALAFPPTLCGRLYFTFRPRILAALGFQPERPNQWVRTMLVTVRDSYVVGSTAFRDAPLASAWTGLTGRERAQPDWQRIVILVLVAFTESCIDMLRPPPVRFPARTIFFLSRDTAWPSFVQWLDAQYQRKVSAKLRQTISINYWRTAKYLEYRRLNGHPILRGFVDQMLATYEIRDPHRAREIASDAATAAHAAAALLV